VAFDCAELDAARDLTLTRRRELMDAWALHCEGAAAERLGVQAAAHIDVQIRNSLFAASS